MRISRHPGPSVSHDARPRKTNTQRASTGKAKGKHGIFAFTQLVHFSKPANTSFLSTIHKRTLDTPSTPQSPLRN